MTTSTNNTVYTAFTQDQRIELLMAADNLGCETVHWYHGGGYCFQVPKGINGNIFEVRDQLRAIMASYGLIEVDSHLSPRHHSDSPETSWYGPYNLPPDPPAYSMFNTYELP